LLQRYTRQLDAQETRLDALQAEIASTETEMEKVRGELGDLISTVSFDLTTR
jgi:septal ring factor EnvC (AmiA/AmiB activator)